LWTRIKTKICVHSISYRRWLAAKSISHTIRSRSGPRKQINNDSQSASEFRREFEIFLVWRGRGLYLDAWIRLSTNPASWIGVEHWRRFFYTRQH